MSFFEAFKNAKTEQRAGFIKDLQKQTLPDPINVDLHFTRETGEELIKWTTMQVPEGLNRDALMIAVRAKHKNGTAMFETDEDINEAARLLLTLESSFVKELASWITQTIDIVSDQRYKDILGNSGKADS